MTALTSIPNHCNNRIKPSLLRDIKTEALLVFARTALERYFAKIDEYNVDLQLATKEETSYVYDTLKTFLGHHKSLGATPNKDLWTPTPICQPIGMVR